MHNLFDLLKTPVISKHNTRLQLIASVALIVLLIIVIIMLLIVVVTGDSLTLRISEINLIVGAFLGSALYSLLRV